MLARKIRLRGVLASQDAEPDIQFVMTLLQVTANYLVEAGNLANLAGTIFILSWPQNLYWYLK
jgi:hypothetical protein